ncbi:MAG TPA: SpoIIE family protein phosphatase [Roseiflexaceae bacterium]|nr:SpoIIE family protein phosphatase [Roseiflexaceae bacterium]
MSSEQQPPSSAPPFRRFAAHRPLFSSLKTRLRWSYALASVIPLMLLGSLLITSNILSQRRNIAANQQTAADWVAREIRTHLSSVDDQLLKFGERARPDQPPAALLEAIFELRESAPEIVDLSVMDSQGRERAHVSDLRVFHEAELQSRADDELVRYVLQTGRVAQGPIAKRPSGDAVYSSYAPLFDNSSVAGVLRAEVSTMRIERSLREGPLVTGSYAYLVDDRGQVQLAGDLGTIRTAPAELALLFRGAESTGEYRGGVGDIVIGAWTTIPTQPTAWRVIVEMPRPLAYQSVQRDSLFLIAEIVVVILTTIAWGVYQARRIIEPIDELRAGARTIGAGDLSSRLPIHNEDEIGDLAHEFNNMAEHLQLSRAEIEMQNERLRDGLALARDIQLGLLPKGLPGDARHLAIHGRSIPAYEVGGDFYTYISLDDSRIAVAIGDISGKGVGAALMMALASSTVEAQGREIGQPQQLLAALNQQLAPRLRANRMNAALLYVVIDLERRTLCAANAGMITPILLRDGGVQMIETYGLPLGAMAEARYSEMVVDLRPGDTIVLVSDGIVEAHGPGGELFGFERLEQALALESPLAHPDQLIEDLIGQVLAFAGDAQQHDDMTVVVISPALQPVVPGAPATPMEEVTA